jgi:hypothetical protein
MTLKLLHSGFPYIRGKFDFFFISVYCVLDALVSADAVELECGEPRDGVVLEGGLHIDRRLRQVEVHPKQSRTGFIK